MKYYRIIFLWFSGFLLNPLVLLPQTPKEAICTVCRVTEGTTKPEKVVATSQYQKTTHYFCSPKCKKEFDADPEAFLSPVLPRPAPDFTLPNLAGEKIALQNFRGQVVLLDFWATWCKPCVKSMPKLNDLHEKWNKSGLSVVGIAIDEEGKKIVEPFIQKHKIVYPILVDTAENPVWEIYKVKIIPMLFLVDRQGQIVQQWLGELNVQEVENAVSALLKKKAE